MTRRERMEARANKREQWAAARSKKSAAAFAASDMREERSGIPLGQPVLVGHHSERRHRRAIDKATAAMNRSIEHGRKADEHAAAAATLRARLDSSIFGDDADAIAALEARAAAHDAEAERNGRINAAWRKAIGKVEGGGRIPALVVAAGMRAIAAIVGAVEAAKICQRADVLPACMISRQIVSTTSPRAAARRDRERIEQITRDRQRAAERATACATANGAVLTVTGEDWAELAFPAKPERAVLVALRAAGWRFGNGAWHGRRSTLPAAAAVLVAEERAPKIEPRKAPMPNNESAIARARESVARLVAAFATSPGRDPLVVLSDCAVEGDASEVWRGRLSAWLAEQDAAIVASWERATWERVRDLSLGRRVMLYLGGGSAPLCSLTLHLQQSE